MLASFLVSSYRVSVGLLILCGVAVHYLVLFSSQQPWWLHCAQSGLLRKLVLLDIMTRNLCSQKQFGVAAQRTTGNSTLNGCLGAQV